MSKILNSRDTAAAMQLLDEMDRDVLNLVKDGVIRVGGIDVTKLQEYSSLLRQVAEKQAEISETQRSTTEQLKECLKEVAACRREVTETLADTKKVIPIEISKQLHRQHFLLLFVSLLFLMMYLFADKPGFIEGLKSLPSLIEISK